jgi:hypothetical protein
MTLDEYAEWAATIPKPEHPSREQRLAYLGLGLAGEAGEVGAELGLQPSALIAAGRAHIEERVAARSVA